MKKIASPEPVSKGMPSAYLHALDVVSSATQEFHAMMDLDVGDKQTHFCMLKPSGEHVAKGTAVTGGRRIRNLLALGPRPSVTDTHSSTARRLAQALLAPLFLNLLLCISALGQNYTIRTFAGGGLPNNVSATSVRLGIIGGVAVDHADNLYFTVSATSPAVFRVDRMTGVLTRIVGIGTEGHSGDNGPATSAQLNNPSGVVMDESGDLYILDNASVVRKVSAGIITTIAGNGTWGYSGDNGLATNAALFNPSGIAVDTAGSLYIADTNNNVIRKVSNGVITTIAGNGTAGYSGDNGSATAAQLRFPRGIAVDVSGNAYVTDTGNNVIRKISNGVITTIAGNGTAGYSGDSGPATSAELSSPWGIAVDSSGNAYVTDTGNNVIRGISNGVITTIAGNGTAGYSGDNGPATSAELNSPYSNAGLTGVAADATGSIFIGDTDNYVVRKVTNGIITTIAGGGRGTFGDNGPATSAALCLPNDAAPDAFGNVYIADGCNDVIRKVSNGVITTFAGNGSVGYSGDNSPATSAELDGPQSVAVDASGNVYFADLENNVIRKVSNGVISNIAGEGVWGYSGDKGPATRAKLDLPYGVAVDVAGNVYIADWYNNVVRKVSQGVITTIAGNGTSGYSGDNGPATSAELNGPTAVAVDASGNVYIAETGNNVVRMVSNGVITTFAGNQSWVGYAGDNGPAASAVFHRPTGVAVDTSGNVYIADNYNNRIRRVSNGVITTIAGNGVQGYSGDNGPATAAELALPWGVAVDAAGNVYVADFFNNAVRVLAPIPFTARAASMSAEAGGGSVPVSLPVGVSWTAVSNDSWITITGGVSGTGSGTVNFSVEPNTGAARTGTITVNGQTFTVEQESASTAGLNFAGSLPQIASAGGWDTALTLVNLGTAEAEARLNLYDKDGNAPWLPFTFPQQASQGTMLGSTFDQNLNAGATLMLDTTGPVSQTSVVGSSQLLTSGVVNGFAIFNYTPTGQQAVVPLETRNAASYLLAFDYTNGIQTGFALANVSATKGNVNVVVRDDSGAVIPTKVSSIPVDGNGHASFMLNDATQGFPEIAGKRGTVEFDTPSGGQISALGLRVNGKAITTLPVLAQVGTAGGALAQVATGGGWETGFTLVNTGTVAAKFTLNFYDEKTGMALPLPLVFPQGGPPQTTATLTQTLAPGATLLIQTDGGTTSITCSAQLTTTGQVSGFAIFEYVPSAQEAVVPLETRTPKSFVLAYDNTNGLASGLALANMSAQTASVPVVVRDDTGTTLAQDQIQLVGNGHASFMLNDNTLGFPVSAGKRGTIEFQTPSGGRISALGIRAVGSVITTIPVLAKQE